MIVGGTATSLVSTTDQVTFIYEGVCEADIKSSIFVYLPHTCKEKSYLSEHVRSCQDIQG